MPHDLVAKNSPFYKMKPSNKLIASNFQRYYIIPVFRVDQKLNQKVYSRY